MLSDVLARQIQAISKSSEQLMMENSLSREWIAEKRHLQSIADKSTEYINKNAKLASELAALQTKLEEMDIENDSLKRICDADGVKLASGHAFELLRKVIERQDLETLRDLLDSGIARRLSTLKNDLDQTCLWQAIHVSSGGRDAENRTKTAMDIVRILVKFGGKDLMRQWDVNGDNCLWYAARHALRPELRVLQSACSEVGLSNVQLGLLQGQGLSEFKSGQFQPNSITFSTTKIK